MILTCLLMLTYAALTRPYKEESMNKMTIANEVFTTIFIALVLSVSYTEQTNAMIGWVLIAFIFVVVICNIVFMLAHAYNHTKTLRSRTSKISEEQQGAPSEQSNDTVDDSSFRNNHAYLATNSDDVRSLELAAKNV